MEEQKLFGKLFESIPLYDQNHIQVLLDNIDKQQSVFYLVQAVKHAYHSGLFSLGEAEIISKSIRILSENDN